MRTVAVTSQPVLNRLSIGEASEQPPTYEEVISQQPKPSTFENMYHDSERISSMETGGNIATEQLNAEQENRAGNAEEEQKRNNRRDTDCCFVCYVGDDPYWIFCRLFSDCCRSLADCTESCCESCADCLHNCCESTTVPEDNTEIHDGNGCCSDCCTDDCSDCDCSCFD